MNASDYYTMNDKDCRPPPRGGVRYFVTRLLAKAIGFVGDYRSRDTPDPIPNSEVKSWPPMILLSGKVGYCRLFQPPKVFLRGLSFARGEPQLIIVTVISSAFLQFFRMQSAWVVRSCICISTRNLTQGVTFTHFLLLFLRKRT